MRREHHISTSPDEQRLRCIELNDDEMSEEEDEAEFTNSASEQSVQSAEEKTLAKLDIPEADIKFIHYRPTMVQDEAELFKQAEEHDATERISNEFININPEELNPASLIDKGPTSHLTSIVEVENIREESIKLKPKLEEQKTVLEEFPVDLATRRASKWVPNDATDSCMSCNGRFCWLFIRKHHCRQCGGLFCGKCSHHTLVIEGKKVRVCKDCKRKSKSDTKGKKLNN